MKLNNETGHAINVANFEDMISFCTGLGTAYNPSRNELTVESLDLLLQKARTALDQVKNTETLFNNATNERMILFASFKTLITRIVNSLAASGPSAQLLADAKTIQRKLQGKRANNNNSTAAPASQAVTADGQASTPKTISASQVSYDSQVDHFAKMIYLLENEDKYNPNEADLKTDTLRQTLDKLKSANTVVINTYTEWNNQRLNRDQVLYNPLSGLASTAKGVKMYIKSVFGSTSPQYRQVSGLKFLMRK